MKNGVYGLFQLDGGPIDPADRAIVLAGIEAPIAAPGCLVAAHDWDTGAIDARRVGDRIDVLLGDLDEHEEDARALGLDRNCGRAALAAAAFDRWGVEAATRLVGDWLLVRWDPDSRTLTLLMSECARDDVYYARANGRVAIAPRLARLARLPWVDECFDPEMVVRAMGRQSVRSASAGRTIVKGVARLIPGHCLTLRAGQEPLLAAARPPAPPALALISFDEAICEAEALLRRIVRQRMAGAGDIAFLLSGGLDSSLLAWLGVEERREGQTVHFLSSAAPEGSGIADETGWAQSVADHLGVPLTRVAPEAGADIYAPSRLHLEASESPGLSPRHYLYDAFEDAAAARGASRIMDGAFGELTVSNHGFFLDSPARHLRRIGRAGRDWLAALGRGDTAAADHLHVKASASALAAMPDGWDADAAALTPERRLRRGEALGFESGWDKIARQGTSGADPRVRYLLPFRDRRLLRMAAAWPAGFAVHDGAPRAIVRALLRGHVPDRIAARQSKMAFSPTYAIMLREQAHRARARLDAQRKAGAGDWLDLDWLEKMLGRTATGAPLSAGDAFRVQGTAAAAEFFRWWHDQARCPAGET